MRARESLQALQIIIRVSAEGRGVLKLRKPYSGNGLEKLVLLLLYRVNQVRAIDIPSAGHKEVKLRIPAVRVHGLVMRQREDKRMIRRKGHPPYRPILRIALPNADYLRFIGGATARREHREREN